MHENEILVLLFGSAILIFILLFREQLQRLPSAAWLIASFFCAWLAWLATVLEHLWSPTLFNLIEHLGYALNGIFLLVWCWFGLRTVKQRAHHD